MDREFGMIRDEEKLPSLPTAEELEAALQVLLAADRRRIDRELLKERRWEALMDEARSLIGRPCGTSEGSPAA